MVLIRKRFFRVHCQDLLAKDKLRREGAMRRAVTFAPVSGPAQRPIRNDQISAPIESRPLHRYIPDRTLAESPAEVTVRSRPSHNYKVHHRHLLRSKTLGQRTIDAQAPIETLVYGKEPANIGLGGYPILSRLGRYVTDWLRLPVRDEKTIHTLLTRETAHSEGDWSDAVRQKVASWLPDGINGLLIGRNSRFYTEELEDEELEQIGGVEYRALRFLSYFVAAVSPGLSQLMPQYIFLCQVLPFASISVYFTATHYWDSAFQASPGIQASSVQPVWASLYFSVAAYTGAGTSLVDQSMVPFASCYLLVWILNMTMLLGNHAFPMVLRLLIWLGTVITGRTTLNQTLHFLLDHPRRYVMSWSI